MTTSSDWEWEFRPPAARAFDDLDAPIQNRIVAKLDEIVTDEWRDPHEYIEPLSGMQHGKVRVGYSAIGFIPVGD